MDGPLTHLSDEDLLDQLKKLLKQVNRSTAQLLLHLGEVDARRLYAAAACSSMFTYCVTRLGLSEPASYKRIQAARAARRHPVLLELLAQGRLHLAGIVLLAPHITQDNREELLQAACGKSKRQIAQLLADRAPQPDAPTRIRKLPQPPAAQNPAAEANDQQAAPPTPAQAESEGGPAPQGPDTRQGATAASTPAEPTPQATPRTGPPLSQERPRSSIDPLGDERYKIQFTADAAWVEQLRRAQDLMSHRLPDGDVVRILGQGLQLLNERLMKERFAALSKPQPKDAPKAREPEPTSPGPAPSRHIPNDIKRQVAQRDGLQCTFVDAQGRRCQETRFLEFHHLLPWARTKSHQAERLTLRCRCHNQHAARQDFGAQHIEARVAARRGEKSHAEIQTNGTRGQLSLLPPGAGARARAP